jgi:hypothetical protein
MGGSVVGPALSVAQFRPDMPHRCTINLRYSTTYSAQGSWAPGAPLTYPPRVAPRVWYPSQSGGLGATNTSQGAPQLLPLESLAHKCPTPPHADLHPILLSQVARSQPPSPPDSCVRLSRLCRSLPVAALTSSAAAAAAARLKVRATVAPTQCPFLPNCPTSTC